MRHHREVTVSPRNSMSEYRPGVTSPHPPVPPSTYSHPLSSSPSYVPSLTPSRHTAKRGVSHPNPLLLSTSSSSLVTLVLAVYLLPVLLPCLSSSILLMALPDSRPCILTLLLFPQVFPSVSAISFAPFCLDRGRIVPSFFL